MAVEKGYFFPKSSLIGFVHALYERGFSGKAGLASELDSAISEGRDGRFSREEAARLVKALKGLDKKCDGITEMGRFTYRNGIEQAREVAEAFGDVNRVLKPGESLF